MSLGRIGWQALSVAAVAVLAVASFAGGVGQAKGQAACYTDEGAELAIKPDVDELDFFAKRIGKRNSPFVRFKTDRENLRICNGRKGDPAERCSVLGFTAEVIGGGGAFNVDQMIGGPLRKNKCERVTVRFSPEEPGTYFATLRIISNGGSRDIDLFGETP